MKPQILTTVLLAWVLSGCRVVGDIFKAGVWVGVVVVVALVAIIGGVATLFRRT